LDKCEEKHFKRKIEVYCLSLESITKQGKLKQRHSKAQLLLDRYKKASNDSFSVKWRGRGSARLLSFKSARRATKPVWGTEQTASFFVFKSVR
jgi:hypothetical protein